MTTTIFVYGSLKRGEPNHRLLARARFVGLGRTAPRFSLFDLGPYPAMTAEGTTSVEGELFEVDAETLARVDRLEGHPTLYERTTIALQGGALVEAYVYRGAFLQDAVPLVEGRWQSRPRSF